MQDILHHVVDYVLPSAFELLPPGLVSPAADALLVAIGLQETRFMHRRQMGGGPARGFWQFEIGGVRAVRHHPALGAWVNEALEALKYPVDITDDEVHAALEHNDALAAVLARCLIYSFPGTLPGADNPDRAWTIYADTWRPGQPRRESWNMLYVEAWHRTTNRST